MKNKTSSASFDLIVGLGNPGAKYSETRHNAGFWFLDALALRCNVQFKLDAKFSGEVAKIQLGGSDLLLLKPATFMNLSGQSVSALAKYFKIPIEKILVVHDELDLPPGSIRIKNGGGHGGHNGLRDISNHLGKTFWRLRVGIGHPGHKDAVVSYVLKRASAQDQQLIDDAIDAGLQEMDNILGGQINNAMQALHSR